MHADKHILSKRKSDLFPVDQTEKMAEFAAIYRDKFARESQELNQVVPQMKSAVAKLQEDTFTAGKMNT